MIWALSGLLRFARAGVVLLATSCAALAFHIPGDPEYDNIVHFSGALDVLRDQSQSGDFQSAANTISYARTLLPVLGDYYQNQAVLARFRGDGCQDLNGRLLQRIGNNHNEIEQMKAKFGEYDGVLAKNATVMPGLLANFNSKVVERDTALANYNRLNSKIANAANNPIEFWNSFDVVFSGDIADRDKYRRRYNNLLTETSNLAQEYNNYVASNNYYNQLRGQLVARWNEVWTNQFELQDRQQSFVVQASELESAANGWGLSQEAVQAKLTPRADLIADLISAQAQVADIVREVDALAEGYTELIETRNTANDHMNAGGDCQLVRGVVR